MHFALVDNQHTAPSPGLTGSCPFCGDVMIAKCGRQRVHHWAHRGERVCDSWWEGETPWHRTWKSNYPDGWQEVIQHDQCGEKHIADVRTEHGLTIEFQRSHLRPNERAVRENFYGNMVWVVDGSRLVRDLPRFLDGANSFRGSLQKGLYITPFPDEVFPSSWLNCSVPVFFDFGNAIGLAEKTMHVSRALWCLLPGRASGQAVVLAVSREDFVRWTHSTAHPIQSQSILENVVASLSATITLRQRQGWRQQGFRRRYPRF